MQIYVSELPIQRLQIAENSSKQRNVHQNDSSASQHAWKIQVFVLNGANFEHLKEKFPRFADSDNKHLQI
jgi:hypothetical protein